MNAGDEVWLAACALLAGAVNGVCRCVPAVLSTGAEYAAAPACGVHSLPEPKPEPPPWAWQRAFTCYVTACQTLGADDGTATVYNNAAKFASEVTDG